MNPLGMRAHRKPARKAWVALGLLFVAGGSYWFGTHGNPNARFRAGDVVDELDGVAIRYNGGIHAAHGRNRTADGYNVGIRYQCVEFVKRYLLERQGHRMPDAYGHARDFYDPRLPDGGWNARRAMVQHANGGAAKPAKGDLVVFGPWLFNRYGHVAIVASVSGHAVEIAQQNPGPWGRTRVGYPLACRENRWFIEHRRVLGWLRLPAGQDQNPGGPI